AVLTTRTGISLAQGPSTTVFPVNVTETLGLAAPPIERNAFNRLRIEVRPDRIRFYGNDSLVYEYADISPTTPWLNLHARSFRRTLFRNASIHGDVRIPREVALTQGDRLDGWISSYYEEAQPPRLTVGMALNQPTQATATPQGPRFPTVTREPV